MKVIQTKISGCYELEPVVRSDARGQLVKTYHKSTFEELGLQTCFPEEYYSVSKKGVLRGLHFQVPPMQHIKLVTCLLGTILDIVVDIRKGSPSYGKHIIVNLDSKKANMLYVPEGCAHGFYTLSEKSIFLNRTSTMYSEAHDRGIHWESCGIDLPFPDPILSEKDQNLPPLHALKSPFKLEVAL